MTAVPKPQTPRDPGLVDWIRGQPCLVPKCGLPGEPCHVRTKRNHGDPENVVPLCRWHHREQHERGVKDFSYRYGLNLTIHAARLDALYRKTIPAAW